MNQTKQRRLVSIMFTDIVGYSRIMQENEYDGFAIRNRHREIFQHYNQEYRGKLLQYFGDGTLSIFNSSTDAVECAIEMQRAFQKDPKVPLRIGIHTGEIILDEDDAFGHGLNVAARIEPICVPGGVYITNKTKADIYNHPWIKTRSLGLYELKNIDEAVEVHAVVNEGVKYPRKNIIQQPTRKYRKTEVEETSPQRIGRKSKVTAGVLAILLGVFGAHRFYLGQRGLGIAFLTIALVGLFTEVEFMVLIPALIAFMEGVLLLVMNRQDFDEKYNFKKEQIDREEEFDWEREEVELVENSSLADQAAMAMRKGSYLNAIDIYNELLDDNPENARLHFSLAVAHSMNRDAQDGFYHLSKAVENGYDDFQKIRNHFTLAYLRSQKEYKAFENQGFQLVKTLPSEQFDLLDHEPPLLLKKLEKLEALGDSLERGKISENEFALKKKEILES